MKNFYIAITICSLLLSCSNKTHIVELPTLRASQIYNAVVVSEFLLEPRNFEAAESYKKRAIDTLKYDVKRAIYLYKRAITICPTVDFYAELGRLLINHEDFKEAETLYHFLLSGTNYNAENGDYLTKKAFDIQDKEVYKDGIILSVITNSYNNIREDANNAGFSDQVIKDWILADPRLDKIRNSKEYSSYLFMFKSDEEIKAYTKSEENLKAYMDQFSIVKEPIVIGKKQVSKFDYSTGPNFEYADDLTYALRYFAIEDKDSVYFEINYLNKIVDNDSVKVVLYSIDRSEKGVLPEYRNIYFRLVSYNKQAEIVDNLIVAKQNGSVLTTCTIKDLEVEVSNFERVWKRPFNVKDADNDIVEDKLIGIKKYKVNQNGKIEEVVDPNNNVPTASTDSLGSI